MSQKSILLIDLDDTRRATRVCLLEAAGYCVETRRNFLEAEQEADEAGFGLVMISLHVGPNAAVEYSNRLAAINPELPILLLTDLGAFVPPGTTSRIAEDRSPSKLMAEVASMLTMRQIHKGSQ